MMVKWILTCKKFSQLNAMPNFWSMAVGNESEDSEPLIM